MIEYTCDRCDATTVNPDIDAMGEGNSLYVKCNNCHTWVKY